MSSVRRLEYTPIPPEDGSIVQTIARVTGRKTTAHNYIFIISLYFISVTAFSQETIPDVISSIAEELAADESDPEAAAVYSDLLTGLAEDPVRINSRDQSEISRLFFLSEFQVRALLEYTGSSGKIISLFEIAAIPGFDRAVASMMAPFIEISDESIPSPDSAYFRSTFLTNLTLKIPQGDTSASGSPVRNLVRYRFTSGNISGGFTAEKDPGERFLDGNTHLPDFFSANIAYSGAGFIKKIIIGDFGARFGSGTSINTGIRTGLSLTTPVNISGRTDIRPYTSTDENNFFRGLASQFQYKDLRADVYYSLNKMDAAISFSDDRPTGFIQTVYKTGLHDKASSLIKKDAVTENSFGLSISYRFRSFTACLAYVQHHLSKPFAATGDTPADIFEFTGDMNRIMTANYSGILKRIILSGEASADNRLKIAIMQGMTLRLSDRLSANLLYRYYEPGFKAFHSNGPGSNSSGDNQMGLLGSFSFEAAKYLFISAGCDILHYPWLKYRNSGPSMASKQELRIKYIPSDLFMAELVYTKRSSENDKREDKGIPGEDEVTVRAVRCSSKYSPSERLTFGTRFDLRVISPGNDKGTQLMQEMNYSFSKIPLKIWLRHSVFNTGNWDSRIYTYENDLLYSFSIPALSGKGSRSYILAALKLGGSGEFRIKYGITSTVQSVPGYIQEIRMQFRMRF